jgi:BirA family biotin operon repressor/biotin-[acetyl-CoA-carboxylase] ligase
MMTQCFDSDKESIFHIERYDELDSTNTFLKQRISQGSASPYSVVLCRRQRQGRGTHGRHWVSLDGNVFMSIVMPLHVAWTSAQFSLTTGLGVARTVQALCRAERSTPPSVASSIPSGSIPSVASSIPSGSIPSVASSITASSIPASSIPSVAVKWPNDVLVDGHKVSGILIEIEGDFAVIGIGINVVATPDDVAATHIQQYNPNVTYDDTVERVLRDISCAFELLHNDGMPAIWAELMEIGPILNVPPGTRCKWCVKNWQRSKK